MGWLRLLFACILAGDNVAFAYFNSGGISYDINDYFGMEISKYSFELCGTDDYGHLTLRKRLHRDMISRFFANIPACTVAMESCSGSQHWARRLQELGHRVMLISAQHVVAYRRATKNDRHDAAAIAEAAARHNVRSVPGKITD